MGASPVFFTPVRYASLLTMTSVPSIKSPGFNPSRSLFALNRYGIVIAGIRPLISPCLTIASLRSGVIDCTWPLSAYVRSPARRCERCATNATISSAVTTMMTMRIGSRRNCIESSLHGLGRHLRLQLPRVEGEFLSRRSRGEEDAAVLRGAFSDRRDQLHVLPDADREARRLVGGAGAVAVPLYAESAATHHARQPAEGRRRFDRAFLRGGGNAR